MGEFIIDVNSVNNVAIRSDLEAFIASRPDADKWSQFFQSSSGQITVDLIAAFTAFLKYDSISSRRENYLPYAQTRGGIVAGAQQLGYSVNRGRNAIIEITFTPLNSGVYPQWYVLGSVNGYGLVLLDETVYNAGVSVTVSCVVGDILDQTIQATTDSSATFRFTEKRVSEDVRIYIGATLVSHSSDILDLLIDKFFIQSNAVGSVDAKFLNQSSASLRYNNGDNIKLEWIELKDISFTESSVLLDETEGTLTAITITDLFQSFETNESVKVNAPLQNETKFTIRGRNDYSKILLLADPDFIAAGGRDTAIAAIVEIFAIRNDLSILTAVEKQALLDSIFANRPFGVQPPIIIDPIMNFLEVAVNLYLESGVVGDPNAEVRAILETYEKKLSTPEEIQTIDFIEIEKLMTASDLIRISRIVVKYSTWIGSSVYRRGLHVEPTVPNTFIYEALGFVRYSGSVEPIWPDPIPLVLPLVGFEYGQQVTDNELIWESIQEAPTLDPWEADKVYRVGDEVRHTGFVGNDPEASFRLVRVLHRSGESTIALGASKIDQTVTYTADVLGAIGNGISLVFDGIDDLDTVTGAWNLSNPANTVSFAGQLGTFVPTIITVTLEGGLDAYDAEPVWPIPASLLGPDERSFVDDNQILWLMIEKSGTPSAWSSNTLYENGDTVIPTIVDSGQVNIMFQMVAFIGKSGNSGPIFPISFGETVIDGHVEWVTRTKTDSPESPLSNEYYLISEDITVS